MGFHLLAAGDPSVLGLEVLCTYPLLDWALQTVRGSHQDLTQPF